MSIFGKGTYTEANVPTYKGYSCETNGDLLALRESYEDQHAIIEALYKIDMAEIELKQKTSTMTEAYDIEQATNEYNVAMEGMFKNAWEKIKAFFVKLWGKLKQFFASIVRFFDGFIKNGKEFATKYEKQLTKLQLSGYEFKMYNYDSSALSSGNVGNLFDIAADHIKAGDLLSRSLTTPEQLEQKIDELDDEKEDLLEKLRGAYLGQGPLDDAEYKEELFAHFRGGAKDESDKDDVKINIHQIISTLKDGKEMKSAEDAQKSMNKAFDTQVKMLTNFEKAFDKESTKKDSDEGDKKAASVAARLAQKHASLFGEAKTVALDFFRAWKTAVTERNSVYKQVCISAFRYKKEK